MIPTRVGDYIIKEQLGTGAFSTVRLVVDQRTHKKYASKIFPVSSIVDPDARRRFENEVRIMQQMHHPNVVQLCDILKDGVNYYVVTEYCSEGELFQHILTKRYLAEPEAKTFLIELLNGLKYLHAQRVVHRDLKPENLLLDRNLHLKISDFGFARFITGDNNLVRTTCGSPCYSSPETFSGSPYDPFKSDIWSTGVILYAMTTGQLPWQKGTRKQLFMQIKNGQYKVPKYLSKELNSLIRSMMNTHFEARPTIDQILGCAWLKGAETTEAIPSKHVCVSLKSVDQFFDREVSEISYKLSKTASTVKMASADDVLKNLEFRDPFMLQKAEDDVQMSILAGGPVRPSPTVTRIVMHKQRKRNSIPKVCSLQNVFKKANLPRLRSTGHFNL